MSEKNEWKLVPVVPTDEMVKAAFDQFEISAPGFATGNDARRAIYAAMLNAAPSAPGDAQDEGSATYGMTLGERIAHVGGRTNAQSYIEFGSPMAVNALIQHVLRDLDWTRQDDDGAYQARYRLPGGQWSSWGHVVCGVKGHEQELRYLPGARGPDAPDAGDALDLTLAQKYEDACIAANANARDAERWRKAVSQWRINRVEVFDGITLSNAKGINWDDLTRQVDAALAAQVPQQGEA